MLDYLVPSSPGVTNQYSLVCKYWKAIIDKKKSNGTVSSTVARSSDMTSDRSLPSQSEARDISEQGADIRVPAAITEKDSDTKIRAADENEDERKSESSVFNGTQAEGEYALRHDVTNYADVPSPAHASDNGKSDGSFTTSTPAGVQANPSPGNPQPLAANTKDQVLLKRSSQGSVDSSDSDSGKSRDG